LPVVTFAQGPPAKSNAPQAPKSSITVTVGNLSCTTPAGAGTFAVQSFSWGASNPVSFVAGGGAGTGKASISSLNIMKSFDACSPALFDGVVKGAAFPQVTLTQRNNDGDPVTVITLEKAFIESWQLSSSVNEAAATESVSIAGQKFCVNDVPSGNKFCFDSVLQK
jgi:type VI protein secretion system component Hcp